MSDRLREAGQELSDAYASDGGTKRQKEAWAKFRAALTEQPDATAPASPADYQQLTEISALDVAIAMKANEKRVDKWAAVASHLNKIRKARELPPAAPEAQVLSEEVSKLLADCKKDSEVYRHVSLRWVIDRLEALLRSPASTSGDATSQREMRKGLPKPENMKWLLDAANQVISELAKQEHLDSDTFRWLCNAVGQVERDLKRSAILEGKG